MTKQKMEQNINKEIEQLSSMMKRYEKLSEETKDETTRLMHEQRYNELNQRKYEALVIRYSLFGY